MCHKVFCTMRGRYVPWKVIFVARGFVPYKAIIVMEGELVCCKRRFCAVGGEYVS